MTSAVKWIERTAQDHVVSGAVIGCLITAGTCTVPATILAQTRGLFGVLGALALVLVYFWSGQAIERRAMRSANAQGMMMTMVGYLARVTLVGVALWWASGSAAVSSFLSLGWLAVGALAAVVGWLAGLVIAHSRSRIAVYDRPYIAPEGWDA